MKITWTNAAEKHLLETLKKASDAIGIQVSVKKMGCSGYGYVIDVIQDIPKNSQTIAFAENYIIAVLNKDLPLLQGINIDYIKEGVNAKLVFNNPNQTGQCGCGESFTV